MNNKNTNLKNKNLKNLIFCISTIAILLACIILTFFRVQIVAAIYKNYMAPNPNFATTWNLKRNEIIDGDYYVSTTGNDNNNGSKEHPFLTIEKAKEVVKNLDKSTSKNITICIEAGEYPITSLKFENEDGGTDTCQIKYHANGEVILNGGINLSTTDFVSASEYPSIYNRLSNTAKDNVLVLDLTKEPYNLTANDWGKLYPIGTYNTSNIYPGETSGPIHTELYINNTRQTIARYPDIGYLHTGEVVSDGIKNSSTNGIPNGDVYKLTDELSNRISNWQDINNVWAYGFWKYDWADSSTPISYIDSNTIHLKYQSFFGTKQGAPYYFYNSLEELTCKNEWYLDRETGLLCIYKPENFENCDINIVTNLQNIIEINANNLTLDGFTIKGSRGSGIIISGNNNKISNCQITNVSDMGISCTGSTNIISNNHLSQLGKGGISVVGGNRYSLTAGNNSVSNNLIHDWAQIYKTYQAGIDMAGVGNTCLQNELYNSPHLAITYSGNNHIIEYNNIHKVCLQTNDSGAIYAGKSLTSYGNHIRYNYIYDIGSTGYSPNGIYMDDAIAGQYIYGNTLINIPNYAIFLGGGRDMNVWDNTIVNAKVCAIKYDARARDGYLGSTWFSEDISANSPIWQDLYNSPWQTQLWQTVYPQYLDYTLDISKSNTAGFVPNPANSSIRHNVIFDKAGKIGKIDDTVYKFSTVCENNIYTLLNLKRYFPNINYGNYTPISDRNLLSKIPIHFPVPLKI